MASWRSMMKIEGSASGSISQRHGSAESEPDPHKNVMDPQHWSLQDPEKRTLWKVLLNDVQCGRLLFGPLWRRSSPSPSWRMNHSASRVSSGLLESFEMVSVCIKSRRSGLAYTIQLNKSGTKTKNISLASPYTFTDSLCCTTFFIKKRKSNVFFTQIVIWIRK